MESQTLSAWRQFFPLSTLWQGHWLYRIIVTVTAICLSFVVTHLLTSIRFKRALQSKGKTKEAPTLPYSFPIVGHAFSMGWDIVRFNFYIAHNFRSLPVRIQIFMTDIYIVTGPDCINSIWKQSQLLRNEIYRSLIVHNMFGMPDDAGRFYLADNSGVHHNPSPGSKIDPDHRIKYLTHLSMTKFLTGSGLKPFTDRFATNLTEQLNMNKNVTSEWRHMPDLFSFIRDELFKASIRAMCGEYILSLNHKICDDFWEFDKGMPSLAKRFPRWLAPSAYAARDKCLENLKNWHRFIQQHLEDESTPAESTDWNQYYGTEFMKSRQKMWSKMEKMSPEAAASEDLGVIWGSSANSIPSAFWLVLEVFRDPSLLSRVRKETENCLVVSQSGNISFDVSKICTKPLLQSIYAETLRLYVSTSLIRSPEAADFKLAEWTIPKGALIMIPSYVVHRDKTVWSTSPNEPRSVETFWPERFLKYPESSEPTTTTVQQQQKSSLPDSASFSLDNLTGCFMPYGGGHGICPGRHFAKQEIISTLAIMVTLFDIELLEKREGRVKPDLAGFGFGALKPKGRVPVRIRRRGA